MNSAEFKNTVCRICLDENVIMDWNNTLAEQGDITYKDCYYIYTQLKPLDADPFSSMLCRNCLTILENTHELILKAIDSYNFFLEVNCINSNIDEIENDINQSTDFETVLVETSRTDTESLIQDHLEYENFDEFFKAVNVKHDNFKDCATNTIDMLIEESVNTKNEHDESDIDQSLQLDKTKYNPSNYVNASVKSRKNYIKKIKEDVTCDVKVNKKLRTQQNTSYKEGVLYEKLVEESQYNKFGRASTSKRRKLRAKYKLENTPSMCSYCSKILYSKYSLQKHEKTHIVNRERKATCPICGVKFFEDAYVKAHMNIHNDNRVKKHKCEFCDKAFFGKGGLNVHRRIHLGQMVPCNLCPKEFFRQVDLDIHMSSHSATLINIETKKRSRYCVRCKYCNKNIMSTSFKSHTAAHLNEPLMKCSICNKEFFRRDSCTQHLKSIHHKSTEEYNEFIVLYSTNRLSHLYLEQTAEIQSNED